MTVLEERIIEGGAGGSFIEDLRELFRFRATLRVFAERHVRVKYKQAVLGIGWAVIQPLVFVAILRVTLGRVRGLTDVVPYAAVTLAAYVAWNFVQGSLTFSTVALISDAGLVRRTYFPREVLVIGVVLATVLDFVIGFGLFMILGPILGAHVTVWWLVAPFLLIPLFVLTSSVSLVIGSLSAFYRDFRHAMPVIIQLWLFASPVAYKLTNVPADWRTLYKILNPAAAILEAFKDTLARGRAPDPSDLGISCAVISVFAVFSYRFFKRRDRMISEVV